MAVEMSEGRKLSCARPAAYSAMLGMSVMSEMRGRRTTVDASLTVIAPSAATPVSGSISETTRLAMPLPTTVLSAQPSMARATCSAVNGSPLAQMTPWRTFSTYSVASSFTSQLSSSMGRKVPSV